MGARIGAAGTGGGGGSDDGSEHSKDGTAATDMADADKGFGETGGNEEAGREGEVGMNGDLTPPSGLLTALERIFCSYTYKKYEKNVDGLIQALTVSHSSSSFARR